MSFNVTKAMSAFVASMTTILVLAVTATYGICAIL